MKDNGGQHSLWPSVDYEGNLLAALDGAKPKPFRPQEHFLWIMNLGDGTGLAVRRDLWWHGRAAFKLKDWIDRRF